LKLVNDKLTGAPGTLGTISTVVHIFSAEEVMILGLDAPYGPAKPI
jgi:molybdopterin-guanine dinucleotide biosynthesis protein A